MFESRNVDRLLWNSMVNSETRSYPVPQRFVVLRRERSKTLTGKAAGIPRHKLNLYFVCDHSYQPCLTPIKLNLIRRWVRKAAATMTVAVFVGLPSQVHDAAFEEDAVTRHLLNIHDPEGLSERIRTCSLNVNDIRCVQDFSFFFRQLVEKQASLQDGWIGEMTRVFSAYNDALRISWVKNEYASLPGYSPIDNNTSQIPTSIRLQRTCNPLRLARLYETALKQVSLPPNHLRVMICGPYGVGKTSCVRLLQGKTFVPFYDSTEGIDNEAGYMSEHTICHRARNTEPGSPLDFDTALFRAIVIMGHVETEEPVITPTSTCDDEEQNGRGQNPNKNNDIPPPIATETSMLETPPKKHLDQINLALSSTDENEVQYEGLTLTMWDFGGQMKYHAMHQMFFRDNCLYLLVLNLQHDKDRAQEVGLEDQMLRYAHLWLNAIVSSAGPNVGLLVVGTHADYFVTKESAEARLNDLLCRLKNRVCEIDWTLVLKHAITAVVDNKNGRWGMELRNAMFDMAKKLLSGMEQVPLRWLRLSEKLRELPLESGHFCLHLRGIIEAATTVLFENVAEDVKAALSFLDKMGEVIYIQEEGLDQWVLPQPRSLLDVLKSLLAPSVTGEQPASFSSTQWSEYTEKGIICNDALRSLWQNLDNHDTLRRFLAQSGVIMELGEKIAVPSLLADKAKEKFLPFNKDNGVHMDMRVQTVCAPHLPHSLFSYALAGMHRALGRQNQPLALMGRASSALFLDHAKGCWANTSPTVKACYLLLEADPLQHTISLTLRVACDDEEECRDAAVNVGMDVVSRLHELIKERFKWITLKSSVKTNKPCAGLTHHDWCMLETGDGKIGKIARSFPEFCSGGEHFLRDTVAKVSEEDEDTCVGLDATIKRAEIECEIYQLQELGMFVRWNRNKCALAKVEDQLVERTACLYSHLLKEQGNLVSGDKNAADLLIAEEKALNVNQQVKLLHRAIRALEQVYICLATQFPSDGSGNAKYVTFLSHRGEEDIKSYVGYVQEQLKEKHNCSAFFDYKSMSAGDMPKEEMIYAAMTCRIGLVTLTRGYLTSKWCLREFGIFTARSILEREEKDTGMSPSSSPPNFMLMVDAFEADVTDLKIRGTQTKIPIWDIPTAIPREHKLWFDHAKQVVTDIMNIKTLQEDADKQRPLTVGDSQQNVHATTDQAATSQAEMTLPERLEKLEQSIARKSYQVESRNILQRISWLEESSGVNGQGMVILKRVVQLEQELLPE